MKETSELWLCCNVLKEVPLEENTNPVVQSSNIMYDFDHAHLRKKLR